MGVEEREEDVERGSLLCRERALIEREGTGYYGEGSDMERECEWESVMKRML